jgi:uncharacterized protein YkwD
MASLPKSRLKIRALLVLAMTSLSTLPVAAQKQGRFDSAAGSQLVQLINQSRAEAGLPALLVDRRLTEAARKHTLRMTQHKELSHQYPDEEALPLRYADENLRSDKQAENIALEPDVPLAHDGFMHSPGHRANILNPDYNAIGVGVIDTGHEIYVTEDFARRMPDYSEHQADSSLQHAIERYASERKVPLPVRKSLGALHEIACKMALNDSLDTDAPWGVARPHSVAAWTANDLEKLPPNATGLLLQPQHSTYALGVCYAPSVSHPGGAYWVVMVFY